MRALTLGAVLLTAATGSSASAPVVADANNRVLGFYTGPNSGNVVSTMGYWVAYSTQSGAMASQAEDLAGANGASVETVYFENIDCTGASYAHVGTGSAFRGGTVGRQSSTSLLFYIPKNEPQVVIAPLSRNSGTGCVLGSGTAPGDKFMRALPNDPSVTGVLDEPAVGPLRLEMAEIAGSSFDLFRNGFEGAFAFRQTSSQFV